MASVDLTKYLTYIRKQGGPGCWGYATLAMWDILNELHSPNPPNLSMNLWLMLHARRDLWEKQGKMQTPDGRYHSMSNPEFGFFQSFGITTEGTEPHIAGTRFTGWFTQEGINEACNYKLKSQPKSIDISSGSFKAELNKWHPIRLEAGPHVVAILGYDDATKKFTFVDSDGDQAHDGDGYGTFTFAEINAKKTNWLGNISKAYTIEIVPPRPVPVAEIWIKHTVTRINVNLWISVKDSPRPKRKLWPPYELDFDDSRTLHYRVRLPSEFIWPPSNANRVVLDLYDSNAIEQGSGGGEVIALRAAFGNHIVNSKKVLNTGPITFKAHEHRTLTIP